MPDKVLNSKTNNKQEKLKGFTDSPNKDNMNQNHNAKKQSQGPNTKH